jgi:hypothetical protein
MDRDRGAARSHTAGRAAFLWKRQFLVWLLDGEGTPAAPAFLQTAASGALDPSRHIFVNFTVRIPSHRPTCA